MKGKKIWGVELVLTRDSPIGTTPAGIRPENRVITFGVHLAQRISGESQNTRGKLFISSKALHARLENGAGARLRNMIGTELGIMQCIVEEPKRLITTTLISPFEYIPGRITSPLLARAGQQSTDAFANLGLATRIEQRMEEYLRQFYPGFRITTTSIPSPSRQRQLQNRGRKISEPTPIEEAIRLSRAHARKNFQKNRKRTPTRARGK
jgi:hypothetical protein